MYVCNSVKASRTSHHIEYPVHVMERINEHALRPPYRVNECFGRTVKDKVGDMHGHLSGAPRRGRERGVEGGGVT